MARRHTLKLRELRRIRGRFALILTGMAAVTALILVYLAVRVFLLEHEKIEYLDFTSLCFYGLASVVMTVAQVAFLRQLTVGAGRRIEHLTYTDELTGLGNRRHIARFLSEELREAQLSHNPLSVCYIDLDRFKQINDRHGHHAGDLVLRAVAHALQSALRDSDFVGRAGGDEFIVVLPDTDSQCASVVAHRIAARLAEISVTVDGNEISGETASIGISSYPANALGRRDLVDDADRTMYAAKNSGTGNIVVSITHADGPEPKVSLRHITPLMDQLETLVDRESEEGNTGDAAGKAEESEHE